MWPQAKYKKKPRAMQVYLYLDILRKTPLDIFPPNRYFPAKHLPRPDPTEPRAGCVIDTGVLKLTVSASAAGLSGTCKACRCGGCFAGRVHAGPLADVEHGEHLDDDGVSRVGVAAFKHERAFLASRRLSSRYVSSCFMSNISVLCRKGSHFVLWTGTSIELKFLY